MVVTDKCLLDKWEELLSHVPDRIEVHAELEWIAPIICGYLPVDDGGPLTPQEIVLMDLASALEDPAEIDRLWDRIMGSEPNWED